MKAITQQDALADARNQIAISHDNKTTHKAQTGITRENQPAFQDLQPRPISNRDRCNNRAHLPVWRLSTMALLKITP